jgi:DNA-binding LacI/PurR family transcriptional regulator
MAGKVTSFDVARRAGVSQPTVSRALRNLPGASPATRDRILAAAAELAYIPSDSGRALSTRNTRRVAVVSEDLTNPFYPELVGPLEAALAEEGLRTVVVTHAELGDVGVEILADGSYDGAILTTTTRRSRLPRDLSERGIPHVLANRVLDVAESPSCAVDNAAGARAVAALVADLGHARVAAIQGPTLTSTGRERSEALRRELRHRGIPLPRALLRRTSFAHDSGLAAALDLLAQDPAPTALVCGNDVMALGALSAARVRGLRVPADLTVIGFDDIPAAGWPVIGLTTVRCDLGQLARVAVDLLMSQLRTPAVSPPEVRRLPVTLVERGTHGPPPIPR